ncbi:hypothetical protein PR202_ga22446 [Eleusine coracana subsp. coracana]|uniref:Wall-associated receptor kinase domain-containing protein n=1 Tax=Eleusine coracana subsp. coracana TaxID=191504 RepID=A0AAV5D2N0_ELECO|nr:hypothetical protein PR202_ga22446 [Eleusine coracana subsp. coracana]
MLMPGFLIQCNDTGNGVFKPFLGFSGTEIVDISLSSGQVRVLNNISYYCHETSYEGLRSNEWSWNLTGTSFKFSDTANKFTVVGCRTLAYIGDSTGNKATYKTGCVAMCRSDYYLTGLANGSCSGMGCCQTTIPSGLQYYQVWFDKNLGETSNISKSPCSYAVLMDSSNFSFSTSYVTSNELHDRLVPVVLDWAISYPYDDCHVASTKPEYACVSSNSRCIGAAGGQGYICNCKEGFQGNPYRPDGCQGEPSNRPPLPNFSWN